MISIAIPAIYTRMYLQITSIKSHVQYAPVYQCYGEEQDNIQDYEIRLLSWTCFHINIKVYKNARYSEQTEQSLNSVCDHHGESNKGSTSFGEDISFDGEECSKRHPQVTYSTNKTS